MARKTTRGGAPAPEPAETPIEAEAPAMEPATADAGLAKWLICSTTICLVAAIVLVLVEKAKYA